MLSIVAIVVMVAIFVVAARSYFDLTYLLILGNLSVFCLTLMSAYWSSGYGLAPLQVDLGFSPSYLMEGHDLYTLLTHMFVHASFSHILFNMLFLFLAGPYLEASLGKLRFAVVYLVGGVAAAVIWSLMYWGDTTLLIGASGAISAVMGGLLVLHPRDRIPFFLGPIFLPNLPVWLAVGAWFVIQAIYAFSATYGGLASDTTAYAAHVAGFVAGMALAYPLKRTGGRIPAKGEFKVVDLDDLAITSELREALTHLKQDSDPQVKKAWLDHFAKKARCPRCGGRFELKGNRLICTCGYERRVR